MSHIALYRSWRPQCFADVVGQDPIIQTLKNALAEGRLTHAYLFNGPRGTGKTSAAKILAKAVNCLNGPASEPCNECEACRRISEGAVMDVIELDAASNNGVDEIRDIRDKVKYAPTEVRYKVYIIDEVHMLTIGAFNALLKTLEEPPAHVIFILATTEPHKLPVTILSRCQRYDFRRISLDAQLSRLEQICAAEGIQADGQALRQIAKLADGGMRDALSLLDQIIAYTGTKVTYEDVVAITGSVAAEQFERLAMAAVEGEIGVVLELVEQMMVEGKSADKCLDNCINYYRDVLMAKLLVSAEHEAGLKRIAELYTKEQLFKAIELLNHASSEMKYAAHPGTMLEVALLQLCTKLNESPATAEVALSPVRVDVDKVNLLEKRIAEVEAKLTSLAQQGVAAVATGGAAPSDRTRSGSGGRSAAANGSGSAGSGIKNKAMLEQFVAQKDSPAYHQLRTKWAQVLAMVRDRNISLNAWLVNGEFVSATDDAVLVAFKNSIHRETTDKPDNRQAIENVIKEVFGRAFTLRTTMLKDWMESADSDTNQQKVPEPLQMVAEQPPDGRHQEEWINEAIDLFGEDMVVIKED